MGPTSAENLLPGQARGPISALLIFHFFTFSIVSCSLDFLGKSQNPKVSPLYPPLPMQRKGEKYTPIPPLEAWHAGPQASKSPSHQNPLLNFEPHFPLCLEVSEVFQEFHSWFLDTHLEILYKIYDISLGIPNKVFFISWRPKMKHSLDHL